MTRVPPDFEISSRRAMVSLGPLSTKRFCTYACGHCYVHAGFTKYPSLSIGEIVDYLKNRRDDFDIVYVSGDTDSFSKPRTDKGIELLRRLIELKCDILFTTRAPLTNENISEIAQVSRSLRQSGRLLIGCVSISRLHSAAHIEPKPIPSPQRRMEVLRAMRAAGIITVLAIRPFMPIIPPEEYAELVGLCHKDVDVVLGEAWYCDINGEIEDRVLGIGERLKDDFLIKRMDFDQNGKEWKVYLGTQAEAAVRAKCCQLSLKFFMRSAPAIKLLKDRFLQDVCSL